MVRDVNYRLLASLMLSVGALSCGGGGSDTAASPAAQEPAPSPIPPMAQAAQDITGMTGQVGITFWGDNSAANGGHGSAVDGIVCETMVQTYHVHTHLAVVLNGQLLTIPQNLGQVPATATQPGCFYHIHNHDMGGRIHVESSAPFQPTLGNWFHVWGQPLSRDNVGGITGLPIVFYVTDNGVVTRWDDDPADIPLVSHRLITIQIGSQLTALPNFTWTGT
jgi:hypothetical protein